MNRYRIPGSLGRELTHYDKGSKSEFLDEVVSSLRSTGNGDPSGMVRLLSNQQLVELVDRIESPSRPAAGPLSFEGASSKAKDIVGDKPSPPKGPSKPSSFDPALLAGALKAGIRVRSYKKGEPKDKPGTDLALPSMAGSAGGVLAAVVPIVIPPAQFPGPVPTGPLNLPGPFQPNAFAPGSFVEPPPAIAPGAGGSAAVTLPGALTAGAIVLFLGALIPSDSGIKQVDKTKIGSLIDKFTKVVREEEERLNKMTFNNDWSLISGLQPKLFARIVELIDKDPITAFKLLKIAFGRTLEDLVAERVFVDPELDDAIDRVGGANQPDFKGRGPLDEFTFDVTTEADLQSHLDRKENPNYGRFLLVFTYERWFKDTLK